MNAAAILALPVLLPLIAAVPMFAARPLQKRRTRRVYLCAVLALQVATSLAVIVLPPGLELSILRLSPALTISLRTDDMACFFLILAAVMFLLVGIYSLEYMEHEGNEQRFYGFYLIVLGLLGGLGLSANLLTMYLFFEIMTLCSMPLVLHSMTKEAIGAAFKYLFYSIAGASMGLLGLFFVYTYGQTLAFVPGGVLSPALLAGNEGAMQVVALLAIIGFGAKAGNFPLHAWLPTAHPVAPAPASAILSGVITKAGVFAVFRFVFYSVGADFLRGGPAQTAWMSLTLVTVVMGSALAFGEPVLKKRMAYSSVSQVSYILFGLSTLTVGGVLGALLHIVFHSVAKDAFFMIAGVISLRTGKTLVTELRGIGRQMPVTLWCFTLVAVTMIGIPPTSGFLSKWFLATGSLQSGLGVLEWLGPVVLLLSALLTAGYLLPITIRGFFPGGGQESAPARCEAPATMLAPIAALALACILMGLFPGGLIAFFRHVVAAIL